MFGFSQSLVDDSTITNISFSQTKYFTKQDVFVGDTIRRSIDDNSRFDLFQHSFLDDNLIQDLGMFASAGYSMYIPYNKNLGNFDGINVYDYLAYQDNQVKYFDTKVPYSNLAFRQNFGGALLASGAYTQSRSDIFNFGFEFKRSRTPLNFGSNPEDVKFSENTTALIHASFITPSKLYKALINFRFMNQSVFETGGVVFANDSINTDSLITQIFAEQKLVNAFSQEKRNEWSFYQELSPFKNGEIKLFHSFDRTKKVNRYEDLNLKTNKSYYQNFYQDTTITKDSNVYRVVENKIGLSGKFGQVSYAGYLKNRSWIYEADTNLWDTASVSIKRKNDLYFGGDLFYQTKARNVNARLNLEIGVDGTRKFDFVSDFKYLKIKFLDLKNLVSLRQQNYQENHYLWSNNFSPYSVREIRIEPYYSSKKIAVSAFWSTQTYTNFVYYSKELVPFQDSTSQDGQLIGFSGKMKLTKWYFSQFFQIASVDKLVFMSVPKLYSHTNIAYNFSFKKLRSLKMAVGSDLYFFTKYSPLGFRSDLQNFVVQDKLVQKEYLILDTYLVVEYKTVDFSLKGINLLQGAARRNGYYPTANYFGRKRGVEIGARWSFFR